MRIAGDRLGVHGKRLHFATFDRIGDADVYVFCRSETRRDMFGFEPRTYDGACVTIVCAAGDDARCE